jgi:hypothetical protein
VHRVPLTPDPDVLEIQLLHFSGALVYLGDGHWVSPEALAIVPDNPDDQLASLLGDLFRDDRERALQGLPPDPELAGKAQHILQAFYDEVIEPSLASMRTDCNAARTLIPRAFGWERRLELLSFHDQFEAQEGTIMESVVAGLENCFNTTKGKCLDISDPVQMNEAGMISHQLALLGVEDPAYNPLNPDLQCNLGWSGTATSTAQFEKSDGSDVTDLISTDVQWEIDSANTHIGIQTQYRIKRGTITWEQKGTDRSGCTHQGGPQSFDLTGQDGAIVIDETSHTYQITGISSHFTTARVTCPAGLPSYTADVSLGPWLITPITPFTENATELSGSYQAAGLNTTYEWKFTRGSVTP